MCASRSINFIDGVRTVTEIWNAVSAEYGPIAVPIVARFLEDLVEANLAARK